MNPTDVPFELQRLSILVVDDDEGISRLISKQLERNGFCDSVSAATFDRAITLLNQQRFDLLIIDYTLDDPHNGIELFLQAREKYTNLPGILITGLNDERILKKAIQAGIRDFVPKSDDFFSDLANSVQRVTKQVASEKKALETEQLQLKQKQLEELLEEKRVLNEKLQWSMIETHHRVKNSLQLVSSLMQLSIKQADKISAEEVQKIISHVQSIATLHDLLTSQVTHEKDIDDVPVAPILTQICNTLHLASGREVLYDTSNCYVKSKIAGPLAVVLNELLSNALKHSKNGVRVSLTPLRESFTMSIENETLRPIEDSTFSHTNTGLKLVRRICESDFHSDLEIQVATNLVTMKVTVPISRPVTAS